MNKEEVLKRIREDFENTRADERYNQRQKNKKYSSLMTIMESEFHIPLLAGEEFDNLANDIKQLYLDLSNARVFD